MIHQYNVPNTPTYKAVLNHLRSVGYKLFGSDLSLEETFRSYPTLFPIYPYLLIDTDKKAYSCCARNMNQTHASISLEEIFLIEEKAEIIVKLNDKYSAAVTKDKIIVDCQEFPISVINELIQARDAVRKL